MANEKKYSRKVSNGADHESIAKEMGTIPPQATEVEDAVLGAILVDEYAAEMAFAELKEDCFYNPRNRIVFSAMKDLRNSNSAIDIITVCNRLKETGQLDSVEGTIYLANLSQNVGSAAHLQYHILILKQKAIQRGLIAASYGILKMAYDETVSIDDLMLKSQSSVFEVISQNIRNQTVSVKDLFDNATKIHFCHSFDCFKL